YEMVTGNVPFQADSAVTIALKHIQEEVVPPKKLNSKIPDSLNKLILKAMETITVVEAWLCVVDNCLIIL
ncbi:MAG: hypothetical protein E7B87_04190, partial [Streptococcus salivarius]|nr:hypothetical protein [Streptococcus salivarius]